MTVHCSDIPERLLLPLCAYRPVISRKVFNYPDILIPLVLQNGTDGDALVMADLQIESTLIRKIVLGLLGDSSIIIHPIAASVQCQYGFVVPDLRLQGVDHPSGNIGGIGGYDVVSWVISAGI